MIGGNDDERAVPLLQAANYFNRVLIVTERAVVTETHRGDAVRLRSEDPSLAGKLVDNVKAAIIERQMGRRVAAKTIARQERLARRIAEAVRLPANMPKERQADMHTAMEPWWRAKRELFDYVKSEGKVPARPDGRIAKAARLVSDFLECPLESPSAADLLLLLEMALMTAPCARAGGRCPAGTQKALRPEIQQVAYGVRHFGQASITLGDWAAFGPVRLRTVRKHTSAMLDPVGGDWVGRCLQEISCALLKNRARHAAGPRKGVRHGRGNRLRRRHGAPR